MPALDVSPRNAIIAFSARSESKAKVATLESWSRGVIRADDPSRPTKEGADTDCGMSNAPDGSWRGRFSRCEERNRSFKMI